MSTIASPRDSSLSRPTPPPRLSTPNASARPSIDLPIHTITSSSNHTRSADASPNRASVPPRRNRAALREYYNIKKEDNDDSGSVSEYSVQNDLQSDVPESELDKEDFDAETYVKRCLEGQSLEELLRTYSTILTEIRALDAEKKALVYDNYSKLIAATETIRRMRANMDPLNPMAATLSPAIAAIYEQADKLTGELRGMIGTTGAKTNGTEDSVRAREVVLVKHVLDTPQRLKDMVSEGKADEAMTEWEKIWTLLKSWRERGVGGTDVERLIEEGWAALGKSSTAATDNDLKNTKR